MGGSAADSQIADVDLVLEGGGVKGIALSTAVTTLARSGYRIRRVAGTSGGAIVGALAAALARADEPLDRLEELAVSLDYERFRDRGRFGRALDRVGLAALANTLGVLVNGGIYEGRYMQNWLSGVLADLGVRTFGDLRLPDDPDDDLPEEQRYGLVVVASDVSQRRMVRLPWDYPSYGLDPDTQSVAAAVRASSSIPFYFRPVRARSRDPRQRITLVDGGMLSNFPLTIFDRTDGHAARWPTIGVRLSPRELYPPETSAVRGSISLAFAVASTMLQACDASHELDPCNHRRTIFVDTGDITAVDFDITAEQRDELLAAGEQAAREFLASWDFQRWLADCSAAEPTQVGETRKEME